MSYFSKLFVWYAQVSELLCILGVSSLLFCSIFSLENKTVRKKGCKIRNSKPPQTKTTSPRHCNILSEERTTTLGYWKEQI